MYIHCLLCFFLLIIGSALRLSHFCGFYPHDDVVYAGVMQKFACGAPLSDFLFLWGRRWLIWLPGAYVSILFGPSYLAVFSSSFLFGLVSIVLAYLLGWLVSHRLWVAFLAGLAALINPVDFIVSTTLRGDIETSALGGLSCLLCIYVLGRRRPAQWCALLFLGVTLGVGALTKEHLWFLFPTIAILALWSFSVKRLSIRAWIIVVAGFLIVTVPDSLYLYVHTHDFLYRVHDANSIYTEFAEKDLATGTDLSKDFRYLPELMLGLDTARTRAGRFVNGYPKYGSFFIPALLMIFPGVLLNRRKQSYLFLVLWVVLTLVVYSICSYTFPFHKEPRYLAFMSVPLSVLVGLFFSLGFELWRWVGGSRWVCRSAVICLFIL